MRWTPGAGVSVHREPPHCANGHTRGREGRLVSCGRSAGAGTARPDPVRCSEGARRDARTSTAQRHQLLVQRPRNRHALALGLLAQREATQNRQDAVKRLAPKCDVFVVVGDNTRLIWLAN